MTDITVLARRNSHERDSHITFQEDGHIYTIDGETDFMSVTTWNHSHFKPFDADRIIASMMARESWPKSKYFGQTPEQIKAGWDANRDASAAAGTKLHYDIECYYNGCPQKNDSIEYQYFLRFAEKNADLVPFRSEWMVWDRELRFAGSIDMVFIQPDGTLMIYDWKRSKGIEKGNGWGDSATTQCISHLPDSNFWHYSLQLNTYKALLEKNYGHRVSEMRLVCCHPTHKDYQVFTVPDLSAEVADLFEVRRDMLAVLA
tara:strand:+ start:40794 stop:41570 length:777 start_codon:yes stop_codon:yes gene_type:complete